MAATIDRQQRTYSAWQRIREKLGQLLLYVVPLFYSLEIF
jgi:hypothetical protein